MAPLDGVRVMDLSRLMPGPLCTMILGDLGADVIKVEQPGIGDLTRSALPFVGDTGAAYLMLNRNKRSITLNLKNKRAQEVLYKLARSADVFVETFQPGVSETLGVGHETISEINERVVYCSISGYGQVGPYRDLVGHDINYVAYSGILGATGRKSGPPVIPATQISDIQGALYAAIAIIAALYRRQRTGKGEFVDISLMDAAVASMIIPLSFHFAGAPTERGELILSGGVPFYNIYETGDRRFISIAALEPKFWVELCKTVGLEKYEKQQFAGGKEAEEIGQDLAAVFREKSRDEWVRIMNEQNIPCAPVYEIREVPSDPHLGSRSMILEIDTKEYGRLHQLATPIRFNESQSTIRLPPPRLGEHTGQILQEIGYPPEEVEQLAAIGAT